MARDLLTMTLARAGYCATGWPCGPRGRGRSTQSGVSGLAGSRFQTALNRRGHAAHSRPESMRPNVSGTTGPQAGTARSGRGVRTGMPEQPPPVVLVADGDEAHRHTLVQTLDRAGYPVTEARTGAEALRLAPSGPSLIILDVRLPDLDGY